MAEEEKTQETSTEQKTEEKSPVAPKTGEQVADNEKEQLKQEIELYKNRAAKWQRRHDELKEKEEAPPATPATETQGDPLATLREKFDNDPFSITMEMIDRASRFHSEKAVDRVETQAEIKRQLRRQYKDFDDYLDRTVKFMKKMAPEKRTRDMWEMAHKVAKTESLEDVEKIKAEAKEKGKEEGKAESLEEAKDIHAASTPRGVTPKETKTTVKLTEDELKMAARFGMTPEKYAEWKNKTKITPGEKARLVQA